MPAPRATAPCRPVRVMHLLHKFGVGGMEVGITKLVNGLDRAKVVSSICSSVPGDSLKERLAPGIQLFEFNRRNGNDPMFVAGLVRLLRRERPDVLHTHRWATLCEGLVAARLAGVPALVHGEHGTLETRRHNAFVQRWVWRRFDRVLSVSSRLGERMAREVGYPVSEITVIRNGVDLARFHTGHRAASRAAFGIGEDDLVIGTVGRLVPVKDQATWLRALALLRSWGARFKALIAGTGPLRGELTALAESLQLADVQFLGNRDDVPQVLGAFDIFVLSSESEGLSNTIQEAMATGLPVVATHVGGADELVQEGRTGLLTPAGDPKAMATAMATLVRDPALRHAMGRAGRDFAELNFGIDRMMREYERLYLEVAASRGAVFGLTQAHEA